MRTLTIAVLATFASVNPVAIGARPVREVPVRTARRVVTIVGADYAFRVPSAATPGPVSFRFVNEGKVRHEMAVALLAKGATLEQFVAAHRVGKGVGALLETSLGALFANAHSEAAAELGAGLAPGRDYVVWCSRRDSAGAPMHTELGMFSLLHVDSGRVREEKRAPVDTIVATEYAFRYPASLQAGHHAFSLVNAGKERHELKMFVLAEGRTLADFMAEHSAWRRDRTQVGVAATPAAAVLDASAGATPGAVIEVDMQRGRLYVLVCDYSETRDGPSHESLGMFGGIRVTARRPR